MRSERLIKPHETIKHENYSYEQIRKEILWTLKNVFYKNPNGEYQEHTSKEIFEIIKDWFDNKYIYVDWDNSFEKVYNENW